MHLRKTNFGGQRPAPVPSLGDQELPAEETVLRVSLRLSDRKRDWIQRGTGNVSLPGLPGGAGSHLRTRLRSGFRSFTGKEQRNPAISAAPPVFPRPIPFARPAACGRIPCS